MMNNSDLKPPCYGGKSPELVYSDCNSPEYAYPGRSSPEVPYPYPLYKDPAMERLKLAHMKQNQVSHNLKVFNWVKPSEYEGGKTVQKKFNQLKLSKNSPFN